MRRFNCAKTHAASNANAIRYNVKVALKALACPSDIGQIMITIDRKTIVMSAAKPYPNISPAIYLEGNRAAIPKMENWQTPFPRPQKINIMLQVQKPSAPPIFARIGMLASVIAMVLKPDTSLYEELIF